ncbi:MAG: hypothetical protein H6582_04580 [Crocinitomicaceae bacterium]|nr:hypothetical protein [Crocinitomicaceae bacterium]
MKKSILLIAPLAFLWSCTTSAEIFDDAYNGTESKTVVKSNDEDGYADYIKNEESNYRVVVDSGNTHRSGLNPSYYNTTNRSIQYDNSDPNQYNASEDDGYPRNYNQTNNLGHNHNDQLGWDVCPYQCAAFFDGIRCTHIIERYGPFPRGWGYMSLRNSPNWYWGYSGYYPSGYMYGDPLYGCGGYNNYYGTPYFNNYYGGSNYYGSNYYGYGGYNSYGYYGGGWNGMYGNPYYGYYGNGWNNPWWGYGGYSPIWGYGIYNSSFNNNSGSSSWSNWGEPSSGTSSNHHYGHRGGTNTGSYSQNNTNYEHTVKSQELQASNSPFPQYTTFEEHQVATNVFESKPLTNGQVNNVSHDTYNTKPVNSSGSSTQVYEKPVFTNANNGNIQNGNVQSGNNVNGISPGTNNVVNNVNSNGPKTTNNQTTLKIGKPAQNQFSSGSTVNNSNTVNSGSVVKGGSYSSYSTQKTYDNPNKYGNQSNPTYQDNKPGTVYNSGSGNNTGDSRRTNSSGTTNNTYNSGTRSTNSSGNYGNRSSSSGSSGSSSSSSSGGTSSSRRR